MRKSTSQPLGIVTALISWKSVCDMVRPVERLVVFGSSICVGHGMNLWGFSYVPEVYVYSNSNMTMCVLVTRSSRKSPGEWAMEWLTSSTRASPTLWQSMICTATMLLVWLVLDCPRYVTLVTSCQAYCRAAIVRFDLFSHMHPFCVVSVHICVSSEY
jgi:hypothetical protein